MGEQRFSLANIMGLLGVAAMVGSIFIDGRVDSDDLSRLGGLLILLAYISTKWKRAGRPQQAAYELGVMDGHRMGVHEGTIESDRRHKVVRLLPSAQDVGSCGKTVANDREPQAARGSR